MKKLVLLFAVLSINVIVNAQLYLAKDCEITFFSPSEIEPITAVTKAPKPILNTATGDIQVKITMQSFQFKKSLMQEHFNENYVESDKYPDAIFKGKINEKVDYTKDGVSKVTVKGIMEIHGVKKEITIDGTITIKGQEIVVESKFNIHIADYNIKIPSVVVKNIAEDVEVKIKATLLPFKK